MMQPKDNTGYGPGGGVLGYGASPFYKPHYGPFGTCKRTGGFKSAAGTGELRLAGIWRATFAEFLATAAFVFIGVASIVWALNALPFAYGSVGATSSGVNYLGVALAWGIAYFAMIYATQHISAGYLNPAATVALVLVGKLPFLRGILYIIAQILGAIVGAGLVKGAASDPFNSGFGGANIHNGPFTKAGAFYVEIIATAILVWVILASLDLGHAFTEFGRHIAPLSPLAVGLTYFVLFLITIPVDGGCMNPVRSFGPAVIFNRNSVWHDQWIFWFGPLVGAIIGALAYELAFRHSYMPHAYTNSEVAPYGPGAGAGAGLGHNVGGVPHGGAMPHHGPTTAGEAV